MDLWLGAAVLCGAAKYVRAIFGLIEPVFLDLCSRFAMDNPPNEFNNEPWVGSANVTLIAAS